ncbi:MAG: type II toxin-antitoxin system CcdA family antitoxin [Stenotrophobium sp.]
MNHPAAPHPVKAKKPVNLSLPADLLKEARAQGLNLSRFLEQTLREVLKHDRAQRWQEENKAAIAAYNAHVERHGVFSNGLRRF